jgi:acyl-coenzyme A synthetase/AMP-(fatty) acid ligase
VLYHISPIVPKIYPNARITHIFASTEAGVGFSVTDGKPGFPVCYLSSPPSGIDLKISENRLFIRNAQVLGNYIGSNARFKDSENWVDTGDVVRIVGDRIHFVGRANGLINVGGNKVMPEVVEAALLAHPFVAGALVFPKSNPFSGSVVAAKVVLRAIDADPIKVKKSIFDHLSQCLETFQIPAIITIVDSIPLNSAGKVIRK